MSEYCFIENVDRIWAQTYGLLRIEYVGRDHIFTTDVLIDGKPQDPHTVDPTKHEFVGVMRPAYIPPSSYGGQKGTQMLHEGKWDRLCYRSLTIPRTE